MEGLAVVVQSVGGACVNVAVESGINAWTENSNIGDDHISKLRAALPKAQLLVERSENWRFPTYRPIDKLVSQLKDAIYEAEIIIDELKYQSLEAEQSSVSEAVAKFKNWFKNYAETVKSIHDRLDYIYVQMKETCDRNGIPEYPNNFSITKGPITTSFTDTFKLYGRDEELRDLIRQLGVPVGESVVGMNESSSSLMRGNVNIVFIVGMGGVGKTTLARMVYNDAKVKSYFENMWVSISESFDLSRITNDIIECATKKPCEYTSFTCLQETLKETLVSKRFLLVLDDAWSENEMDWQHLLGPMREGCKESVVLVTTRSQKVAEVAGRSISSTGPIIFLKGLEKDIYWKLFKSFAFGFEDVVNPGLENIGKEIAEKLKGSPLAAKTIGGLLRINLEKKHWCNVRDSKMWQLEQKEKDILPVLQLSYQYLPSHLKKCFSFCSLYPKGHTFTKSELTRFWLMHGFIGSQENPQVLEVLAECYFQELERRCMFEKVFESSLDKYSVHDLMRNVCQSLTKDECFCLEDEDTQKVPPNIRHVLVHKKTPKQDDLNALFRSNKLISLSVAYTERDYYPLETIGIWCKRLTNIRSLSLVRCQIAELPESIGNLKHLKYLDISSSMIKTLPRSFCSLYNLEILNMEGCSKIEGFPQGSNKLVSLQLFYFPSKGIQLGHVSSLAKVILVKNLDFTLDDSNTIAILKHVSISGSLSIHNLNGVPGKQAAEEAHLNKKPLISRLDLSWADSKGHTLDQSIRDEHSDEEVLQGLCPHGDLKELTIKYYRGRNLSPSWLEEKFLPALTIVRIEYCSHSTISHLPRFITELSINSCKHLTDLQNILRPNYLRLIKKMFIWDCEELELLSVESFRTFSLLKELSIRNCPKLTCRNALTLPRILEHLELASCGYLDRAIPTCLENLTLQKLEIVKCKHVESISAESTRNLASLVVKDCENLRSLPLEVFGGFTSLEHLKISNCPKLTCVSAVFLPPSLKELTLGSCGKLEESIPWCLNNLTSLETLKILRVEKSFSIPAHNLRSLSSLHVRDCANLESIYGLESLPSLPKLDISGCPRLRETGGQNKLPKLSGSPGLSDDERPTQRPRIN